MAMASPTMETIMNRNQQNELIDLGAATVETRGGPIGVEDLERTKKFAAGLSAD